MIVDKEIISKINRDYFFISGIFNIDAEYFKKRIKEGIKNSQVSYTTNVVGERTDWNFFNKDKNFGILLGQLLDYLEESSIDLEACHLEESWGLMLKFADFTKRHSHHPSYFSGVLYLHDHHQKLYFPEIKQEITPQKGRFVIFSSFLQHYTKRNLRDMLKYAISFNFHAQGLKK